MSSCSAPPPAGEGARHPRKPVSSLNPVPPGPDLGCTSHSAGCLAPTRPKCVWPRSKIDRVDNHRDLAYTGPMAWARLLAARPIDRPAAAQERTARHGRPLLRTVRESCAARAPFLPKMWLFLGLHNRHSRRDPARTAPTGGRNGGTHRGSRIGEKQNRFFPNTPGDDGRGNGRAAHRGSDRLDRGFERQERGDPSRRRHDRHDQRSSCYSRRSHDEPDADGHVYAHSHSLNLNANANSNPNPNP